MHSNVVEPVSLKTSLRLPESLNGLARVIGLPAALILVKNYGGSRLYIPKSINKGHYIHKIIGTRAAKNLSLYYGGDTLSVPKAAVAVRAARDRSIKQRYSNGTSASSLAREYNLTERRVWDILKQPD